MTTAAPTLRIHAPSYREDRPHEAVLLAASLVASAVAAGILLLGTPLQLPVECTAAALSQGTAVLLLSCLVRGRPSRRWLCVAAVLAVPFLGNAVATTLFVTRGRDSTALRRRRKARWHPAPTTAAIRRLGGALSTCDALHCSDAEVQHAALSALSQRRDPERIALLRRAATGRDPDLALSAALVLDEISEHAERQMDRLDRAGGRHATG